MLPFLRTDKTVVDRISRFVAIRAILDYSSAANVPMLSTDAVATNALPS
jgi:hypothetical protein